MQLYSTEQPVPGLGTRTSTVPRLSYGGGLTETTPGGMVGLFGSSTGGVRADSMLTRPYLSARPLETAQSVLSLGTERQRSVASVAGGGSFAAAQQSFSSSSVLDPGLVRTPRAELPAAPAAVHRPATAGGDHLPAGGDDNVPPPAGDDEQVVPQHLLGSHASQIQWDRHPCAPIVLLLLNSRGAYLPQHKDLFEYHMAEQMLEALSLLQHGAFFIKYAAKRSSPKERYFVIRMLPDADEKPTPFLTWQLHQTSFQIIDRVPLADLVGITCNAQSIAFRRYLVTPDIIKACHTGTRVAKVSTAGCFSLWFYDRRSGQARSLDLLTCSEPIFSLWTAAFAGILSVNSSTVSSGNGGVIADPRQEMREFMLRSQREIVGQLEIGEGGQDDDMIEDGVAGFLEN